MKPRACRAVMGDGRMVAIPGVCGRRGLTWWAGSARLTGHPPCPSLQEHPECLPGAGGHPGSEPRAATQVHHAGHGHHAEAGEAVLPGYRASWPGPLGLRAGGGGHLGLGSHQPHLWPFSPAKRGPGLLLLGLLPTFPHRTHTCACSNVPNVNSRAEAGPSLMVLSSQGPRVEILAKNLRVKDQMPQGAPR